MQMPWTKLEKKTQRTFTELSTYFDGLIKGNYRKMMDQLNIVKKSEQFKHNDHERRIAKLEGCFKEKLEEYKAYLAEDERQAAKEVEELYGVEDR